MTEIPAARSAERRESAELFDLLRIEREGDLSTFLRSHELVHETFGHSHRLWALRAELDGHIMHALKHTFVVRVVTLTGGGDERHLDLRRFTSEGDFAVGVHR